ncbi:MAG: DUF3105 domain-containing protein [Hydrococcus sp. Prado102]|jgi:hypothetical protein|nr:DUF3105 domain-containing protein [Hydrococcus sp. Prado102]
MTDPRSTNTKWKRRQLRDRLTENSWLIVPIGVIVLIVAIGVTSGQKKSLEKFSVTTPGSSLPPRPTGTALPGTPIPDLGQEHVPESQRVKYNSNPPTSGAHHATPAAWGIYHKQPPLDERLVHNLEHGGIIISYHPDRIKGQDLEKIQAQARELSAINPRIIVTPRANLDSAIALTAWGYLQKLDSYNAEKIKAFYDAHIARAPECSNGQCPL